ncbi:hypothetical protein F5Y16DRAFT_375606 [Xylariaceae sp. FL0255]|nr:hypothetical protein F5Y16DRAFT_375606 [Xylariaceae sp. FL0255]
MTLLLWFYLILLGTPVSFNGANGNQLHQAPGYWWQAFSDIVNPPPPPPPPAGVGHWLKQAGKIINKQLSELALQPARDEGIFPSLEDITNDPKGYFGMAMNSLGEVTEKLFETAGQWTKQTHEDFQQKPMKTSAKTMWTLAKLGAFFYPGAIWGPVLGWMGFRKAIIMKGFLAPLWQSKLGKIAARSLFATAQSAGSGGYGVARFNLFTRAGMFAWESAKWATNIFGSNTTNSA